MSTDKLFHTHNEETEEDDDETMLRRERTHSLDSLETTEQAKYTSINCGKFTLETQHASYDVDLDINVSHMQKMEQQQLECSELSDIPEVKIDFEYKLKSAKEQEKSYLRMASSSSSSNQSCPSPKLDIMNEETAVVKQRTRESLKFWKQEEAKEKRLDSSGGGNGGASMSVKLVKLGQAANVSAATTTVSQSRSNKNSSYVATHHVNNVDDHSSVNNEQMPVKCVKDRINVFESKSVGKSVARPVVKQTISVEKIEHVKYRQRGIMKF